MYTLSRLDLVKNNIDDVNTLITLMLESLRDKKINRYEHKNFADVFDFALPILKYGGHFVTKLFQGVGVEELIELVKPHFQVVKRFSPMASRNSSSEVYLICKFHTPKRGPDWQIRPAFEDALEHRQGGPEPDEDVEPAKSTFQVRKKKTD